MLVNFNYNHVITEITKSTASMLIVSEMSEKEENTF